MKHLPAASVLSLALAGCADGTQSTPTPPPALAAACKSDGLDRFIGQKATADLAAQMLTASGAKMLRWAPPRSAMTMDFRPDRLTIAYDDAMAILSARCG